MDSEFLQQIPIGAFLPFVGIILLSVIIMLGIMIGGSSSKPDAKHKPRQNPAPASSTSRSQLMDQQQANQPEFNPFDDSDDLPDLSELLDFSDMDSRPFANMPPEMEPVFSVMRDTRDGRLVVEIDGHMYRTLVGQAEVKRQFLAIIKELSQAINTPDPAEDAVMADAEPVIPPARPVAPPVPPPVSTSAPEREASEAQPKSVQQFADGVPGALPTYNLEDGSTISQGRFGRTKYEAKPIPELNVAAAIEAFLQFKLGQTPEFSGRHIHVHNAPGGFVRIQVDDEYYEAVGDVDDQQIREFLSSTIQEWQSRQRR